MEVLQGSVCFLCQEVTAVLTPKCVAPYIKYLLSTFFDTNKDALEEFQMYIVERGMCALCSHRVVIAHKFKDTYEDVCKKSSDYKKPSTGCFLCEKKGCDLIETETNPNSFITMISSFMEATLFPRSHLQCVVCFDCIFYLNVWFKVFKSIKHKCHKHADSASPLTTRTKAQKKVHFNEDPTVIGLNGPTRNTENRLTSISRRSPPPLSKTRKNRAGPLSTKKRNFRNIGLKAILKKQLKHLRTIKQLKKNFSPVVVENTKMYLEIPYVLLSREQVLMHNALNRNRERSNSLDAIEISDSDEAYTRSTPTIKKKVGFKIKMSAKFLKSSEKRGKRKQQINEFACDVCDKKSVSLSEYKLHALWHDKPEIPFVNVTRANFSKVLLTYENEENVNGNDDSSEDLDQETNELVTKRPLENLDDEVKITDASEEEIDNSIASENDKTIDNIEEVETNDTHETKAADAQESDNVDVEQSESADAEQSESANAEQTESADAEQSESADAEQSESADAEQSESVDAEQSESVDAEQSESANAEQSENADAEQSKDAETDKSKNMDEVEASASSADRGSPQEGDSEERSNDSDQDETNNSTSSAKQKDTETTPITEDTSEHDSVAEVDTSDQTDDSRDKDLTQIEGEQIQEDTHESEQDQVEIQYEENNDQTIQENIGDETSAVKEDVQTGSADFDDKQDEFNSDSENIDSGVDISTVLRATDNDDANSDSEHKPDAMPNDEDASNDSLIQTKKRSIDDNINNDDSSIFENGDDFHKSKRARLSDSESDIVTANCTNDTEACEGTVIETSSVLDL